MKINKIYIVFFSLIVITGAWFYFSHQARIEQKIAQLYVPSPVSIDEIRDIVPNEVIDDVNQASPNPSSLSYFPPVFPPSFNLAIPFTSQAPHKNWDLPYQEACEEASVLMAVSFLKPELVDLSSADSSNREILSLVDFETKTYGDYKDTTADETVRFAKAKFPGISFSVVNDPTPDDIKREVAKGHPVIVPSAGKKIPNPNYSNGGPLYHMLVIRGYTEKTFITNDSGTRLGEEYVYDIPDIMNAMGDWNDGHPESGAKRTIVVQ